MPNNYVLLETIALTQSAASVTFDNLPTSGYTDLKIVASVRDDFASVSVNLGMKINGSSTGLSGRVIFGTGTSANSTTVTDAVGYTVGSTGTANTYSSTEIYIPNYRSTTTNKSYSADSAAESNTTTVYMQMLAGLWSNNAAITSINLYPINATNLVAGSTFSLYGIAALGTTPVTAPKATGGNIVANDGTYWYHAFISSGYFVPQVGLTADYLVVAGGGAGGAADTGNYSGGGGAGGLRSTVTATGGGGALESPLAVASGTSYAVTIGAGGTASAASWTNGVNSTFATITSTGGGAGGGLNSSPAWVVAASGGSGGGGDESSTAGAAGTTNQGRAGGTSPGGPSGNAGGGGGGAGVVGSNGTTNNGGAGGAGVAISTFASATTTGVSNFYAGGGGGSGSSSGGAGGSGGGGAGSTGTATAGTANTGGGGGSGVRSGAAGGSGIVIIRYPIA